MNAFRLIPAVLPLALAGAHGGEQAGDKVSDLSRSKLLEGIGGVLEVYQVPESSGADSSDAHCYIICDRQSGGAMIIDAGLKSAPAALERARNRGLRTALLVSTHFHGDHTGGNSLVLERTSAKMVASYKESRLITGKGLSTSVRKELLTYPTPRIDITVKHGDELKLGSHVVQVIEVSGHSPGGICLHFPQEKILFTGDVLMKGTIGRLGLPYGSRTHTATVRSIQSKLLDLPEETRVFPGHGPSTTIGTERKENPWFQPEEKPEK